MGLIALALALYQPWRKVPFDVLDYSEFLPILAQGADVVDRTQRLVAYYTSNGRANPLTQLLIALNWSLFGDNPVGWQFSLFVSMCAVVVLACVTFRRSGATYLGAATGAGLFLVSSPATEGWLRLTGEALATILLISALLLASSYGVTARWRGRGFGILGLIGCMLLVKETMIVCVPVVLATACWNGGRSQHYNSQVSPRNGWLLVSAALIVVVAVTAAAMVVGSANRDAYTVAYGTGPFNEDRMARVLSAIVLPIRIKDSSVPALLGFPANAIFIIVLASGLWALFSEPFDRKQRVRILLLDASLAVLGALVYLPWPRFESFYALPFLIAPARLLALAVSALQRRGRLGAVLATAGTVGILMFSAVVALRTSQRTVARREAEAEVAGLLTQFDHRDTVWVVTRHPVEQSWQGTGATLRRYAAATIRPADLPTVHDRICTDVGDSDSLAGHILLVYANQCGSLATPSRVVRRYFRTLDCLSFAAVVDSVRVDLSPPMAPRTPRGAQANSMHSYPSCAAG